MLDADQGVSVVEAESALDRPTERLLPRENEAAEPVATGRTKRDELFAAGVTPSAQIGSSRRLRADAPRRSLNPGDPSMAGLEAGVAELRKCAGRPEGTAAGQRRPHG